MKIKRIMLGLLLFLMAPLTAAAPQITVDRDLPAQAEKGQMVSASLEMNVNESDPPPLVALREFVPFGWEASNISHSGYFLSSAWEIRWAFFAGDVVDSTITYNLHIPQDASGEYTINGSIVIPEGTTLRNSKIMISSQDISSSSSGGGGGGGPPPKPKIILLANSIDLNLCDNFSALMKAHGIDVVYVNAENFSQHKTEKFIVILGGPDAPEGVGNITRGVLNLSEQEELRVLGTKKMYIKTNVWRSYNQVIFVIAGSRREQTMECSEENKLDVKTRVKE